MSYARGEANNNFIRDLNNNRITPAKEFNERGICGLTNQLIVSCFDT